MARHKKVGRPKGSKSKKDNIVGCSDMIIFRKIKGRVQKVVGKKYKSCLQKIK